MVCYNERLQQKTRRLSAFSFEYFCPRTNCHASQQIGAWCVGNNIQRYVSCKHDTYIVPHSQNHATPTNMPLWIRLYYSFPHPL